MPQLRDFDFEGKFAELQTAAVHSHWLKAREVDGPTNWVEFGDRVVLQLRPGASLESVVKSRALELSRVVSSNVFILQAPNAVVAALEASRLAALPEVEAGYPVVRQPVSLDGLYAARPNDPHFPPQLANVIGQWYLENRDVTNGAVLGPDLNVRGAWPYTRGEGVTLAIADTGIEPTHRELTNALAGAPHRNFNDGSNSPAPLFRSGTWAHGTECAGLAIAAANNAFGMSGVAPGAKVAGWVVFTNTSLRLVSDDRLLEMFTYAPTVVGVQSFSWTHAGTLQVGLTTLENMGIESAVRNGRDGRGVVLLRPSGNDRGLLANANDDGYCSDPRVITVGVVGRTGRVTSFSERGACLLVAAPSEESGLFTTDLQGSDGANFLGWFPPFQYLSDFVLNAVGFISLGFKGTSVAPPQIAGVTALVLSANTNLTYRDVQQVLLLSARHFDFADPDLQTNGAGLLVGHNDGFGVPDAGHAVKLARHWVNRPAATNVSVASTNPLSIPDDGLRLLVTGEGVPPELASIRCVSGTGPHPDTPTLMGPLVDVGLATNAIQIDLRGKAALIERGTNNFDEKILRAAMAGAGFAVIYNFATNTGAGCPGGEQLCLMGATDFVPIPSVFIGRSNGVALQGLFATNSAARAQLRLNSVSVPLTVTNTLSCEHVGVRVQTDHPLRGDVRITLVSPTGTRSVLQQFNSDTNAGPVDWTYWSTHHFYEPSAGEWRIELGDESLGAFGNVLALSLLVTGIPIVDSDNDGLDDDWETSRFGNLLNGPRDDPDDDGYNNAMEQAMSTDPMVPNEAFRVDLTMWSTTLARLSWPGLKGRTYEVLAGADPAGLTLLTNLPGRFPETEWFTTTTNISRQFFRVHEVRP